MELVDGFWRRHSVADRMKTLLILIFFTDRIVTSSCHEPLFRHALSSSPVGRFVLLSPAIGLRRLPDFKFE